MTSLVEHSPGEQQKRAGKHHFSTHRSAPSTRSPTQLPTDRLLRMFDFDPYRLVRQVSEMNELTEPFKQSDYQGAHLQNKARLQLARQTSPRAIPPVDYQFAEPRGTRYRRFRWRERFPAKAIHGPANCAATPKNQAPRRENGGFESTRKPARKGGIFWLAAGLRVVLQNGPL